MSLSKRKDVTVLVAEDIGAVRTLVSVCLKDLGVYNIVEAPNGAFAIELFDEQKIDLVITDINMPEATGMEVLAHIRRSSKTVPVVMLTSESEKKSVMAAIQAGANDYIIKPFDKNAFAARIDRWIKKVAGE